jgi:cytochrome P450
VGVVAALKGVVRRTLIARSDGIDLSRLDKVPDSLSWPLKRDRMAPSARLSAARDEAPVHKLTSFLGIDVWLVTGDAESRELLGNTTAYSTDIRPYMGRSGGADGDFGGLGFTDPPEHTRQRKFLTPEFTMRRLRRLVPMIEATIDRQLDEIEAAAKAAGPGQPIDLVPAYAFPVPFLVICDLLGLPDEKREKFGSLATARFDVSGGGVGTVGAIGGSREFLLAETTRQRADPGEGLIGQILREHGDEINDFDLGGLADGVFTGGLETSASMLALGTAVLLENRDLWDRLRTDPDSVDDIVEELLRMLSVVQVAFPRFPKEDVVVAGIPISKGSVVLASLPAANRDGRATPGDEIDLARANGSHLAFGYGFHRCIGAELARMELRIAFPRLARRFPDMALAVPTADLDYRTQSIVYGVESLPVTI